MAFPCVLRAETSAATALHFLEQKVAGDPVDFVAWNQLGTRHLQLLRESGELAHLAKAAKAAEQSLLAVPAADNPGGLALLTRVQLASHRFGDARKSAEQLRALTPGKPLPLLLLADACLELGDYATAAKLVDELTGTDGDSVDTEARRSRLAWICGDRAAAQQHLASALEFAQALGSRSGENVAWCHVQLGELHFRQGDWPAAERHYGAALAARPGYWAAEEHVAELRGAQGQTPEAIALYEQILARTPRPELQQALGDLYQFSGNAADAAVWHERALASYMASVKAGDVHYLHHLSGFFAESQSKPAEALQWAKKDLALRQSISAYDALAWALYLDGQIPAAVEAVDRALATGTKDSHLLYHAGMIRMSAGDLSGGKAALQEALQVNPRYHTFHVHR